MNILKKLTTNIPPITKSFSVSSAHNTNYSCKLLVIGGGSGGCAIAAKFARRLKKDEVYILEPNEEHYFQPLWTLVGAGVKTVPQTRRRMKSVLPSNAKWLKDAAVSIKPKSNSVMTKEGHEIQYEYLVVCAGLQNDYAKVPGMLEALKHPASGVSTIYSAEYCGKTWADLRSFKGGEAVFTYPDTPIKCPGAPQKIAYLTDSYLRMSHVRSKSNITYNTCLPVIFGVKKYADALMKVVERKNIKVNYKTVLKEVRSDKKEAVFYTDDKTKEITLPYDMLHVTPPMKTPEFLARGDPSLVDGGGFLAVDKYTLRHARYPNVYGLGDCINTPNSKTVAAVAKQLKVVEMNLSRAMSNDEPNKKYDGYGACPLLTEYGKCILAEFVYDGVPHETMPFNQARESTIAYYMKKDLFPLLYWTLMVRGYYNGPEIVRNIINPLGN
ncbi:unnamed protein product [Diatraea saccharalis]|uniref:Sulfide:quinone oxidoreductase, mitochondrial n=1 Tax=Diatraea saccharalis TaxID=40085 RepID=A0A9N9W8U8_9NEOP|nr:unnamed protein product [Diatraea saccharalis]